MEVLIVENQKGDIFIVENKDSKPEIEKILMEPIKNEDEEIIVEEEYLDEEYLQEYEEIGRSVVEDHAYTVAEVGLDQGFQFYPIEVEDDVYVAENELVEVVTKAPKQQHKYHQLTGKAACKYCETTYKSKSSLKFHQSNFCKYLQCDPKNFICRTCGKELSKKTFSNHLHETNDCQYCNKSFVNPRNLKAHILKIHHTDEIDYCKTMKYYKDLETGDDLGASIVKPKKKYPRKVGRYECDLCGRILRTTASLKAHFNLHSRLYKFVCENCGEKFTTKTGIQKHSCERRRRRPEVEYRIADVRNCKYCDCQFPTLEDKLVHSCEYQSIDDPKIFKCRYCSLDLSKNSYNKHMKRHLDTNKYVCKVCNKELANESALQVHLTVHSGDKPFKCDICDKSYINKYLLNRHSRFHGKEDLPVYKCELCDKEIATKYHLKTHLLTVHQNKAHCQVCKEKFSSREALKEHYKAAHQSYNCETCGKSFVVLRYLKMHEKLHRASTTEFFKCIFCTKKFSKRSIADHVYKTHNEHFSEWRDQNLELI